MAIEIHIFAQINKTKFVQNNIYIGAPSAQNYFKYDLQAQTLSVKKKILTCFCSIFIGIVNGLFGAGGGMLAVPCLNYICGLDEKSAHATAIAVILPVVIGVTIGGILGALFLKKISPNALSFLFYALMTFAGFKMIFD